ncbi:transcription factor CRF1-domain-containing protein [Lipomyces japonicus]|uniref:transcription factor CRF1-domain-containing protein n=1 Tax=Lipomyces japonicus TaxID=56871 RepID=UPI0034CFEFBE
MSSQIRRKPHKNKRPVYDNPYSSDSSDSPEIVVRAPAPADRSRTKSMVHSPKRRRNSTAQQSSVFQSSHNILDSQLFAIIADADVAEMGSIEFDGLFGPAEEDEDDEDDEEDDDDDDEEEDNDEDEDEDDDGDDNDDDEDDDDDDDDNNDLNLSKNFEEDDVEDDEQIELEEEAAIVEELSLTDDNTHAIITVALAEDMSSDSSSRSDNDELSFTDTLFVDKADPVLKHIVSSAPKTYNDSDDDSFVLDYLFSSGETSEDDQNGDSKFKKSRRRRRQRQNTFNGNVDDSDEDEEENEAFDLKNEDVSSGLDISIRRNGNYYEVDDGESTDEDENLPPPSHQKAGHRATEIIVGPASASRPPVLGSWVLPAGRHIGIINGLTTRTLSPPPYPRGEDELDFDQMSHNDLESSPTVLAATRNNELLARQMAYLADDFGCDTEQGAVAMEDFIYMSELDNDEDDELSSGATSGPITTPVWAGKFHSRFPLSAFRTRSSMQYRSI